MSRRIVLLIIFICAGCSIMVNEPGWISGPPVFEKGGYIYSVGSSSGKDVFTQRQAAEDSAKTQICRFLKTGDINPEGTPSVWHDDDEETTHVLIRCKIPRE